MNTERITEDDLREKRFYVFKKFDTYKSLVNYGVITENTTVHAKIIAWYKKCLDVTKTLDESCLKEVPEEIQKY